MAISVNINSGRLNTIGEIKTIGTIREVNDVRIRSLACPRVNDESIIESWSWAKVGSLLIATASAYYAYRAANERYKIAKRYWALARDNWDFFYNNYRPLEKKELAEIRVETPYQADYKAAVSGFNEAVPTIFNGIEAKRKALADKYCLCPDPATARYFALAKSTALGDMNNFARRYADNLADTKNDTRFARMVAAANRGRNMLSQSTAFAQKATSFYGDYANALNNFAADASKFAGYLDKRRPTVYNSPSNGLITRPNTADGSFVSNTTSAADSMGLYSNTVYVDGVQPTENKLPLDNTSTDVTSIIDTGEPWTGTGDAYSGNALMG